MLNQKLKNDHVDNQPINLFIAANDEYFIVSTNLTYHPRLNRNTNNINKNIFNTTRQKNNIDLFNSLDPNEIEYRQLQDKKLFDIDSIKSLEVDGLRAQRNVQGDNGKVAVVGRAMGNNKINGVRDYAAALQKQGYDVELFDGAVPAPCVR